MLATCYELLCPGEYVSGKWRRQVCRSPVSIIIIIDPNGNRELFFSCGATAQPRPWPLQFSFSKHLYPLPTFSSSCILTYSQLHCLLLLSIFLCASQPVITLLCILSVLSQAPFRPSSSTRGHPPESSQSNIAGQLNFLV